jgi:hypothetical protein
VATFDGGVSNLKLAPLDEDTKAIAVTGEWCSDSGPTSKIDLPSSGLELFRLYLNDLSTFECCIIAFKMFRLYFNIQRRAEIQF